MTTTAHNSRRVYGGGTRQAAHSAPRTAPIRRHQVSWLHCPVDKFVRLLAQHEAGEIDLRLMPVEEESEEVDE